MNARRISNSSNNEILNAEMRVLYAEGISDLFSDRDHNYLTFTQTGMSKGMRKDDMR